MQGIYRKQVRHSGNDLRLITSSSIIRTIESKPALNGRSCNVEIIDRLVKGLAGE